MKVLVLSDIHFPHTDETLLKRIIRKEDADKVVLLGDVIDNKNSADRFFSILDSLTKDWIYIRGDEDAIKFGLERLRLKINGKNYLFMHGHQFPVINEGITAHVARLLKKVHPHFAPFVYALYARIRLKNLEDYLVLGHAHVLVSFPIIMASIAGTLSTNKNVYQDLGYITIENGVRLHRLIKHFY